jgi:hypothetical protein
LPTANYGVLGISWSEPQVFAITNARLFQAVERQRHELARFLSPAIADLVSSEDGRRLLAGHRAYVTVLFADLRGFTSFAETAEPEDLFEVLRDYHGEVGKLIETWGGTLEHFAGDGLMIFFNDPVAMPNHEIQAARMAVALRDRMETLSSDWRKRGIDLAIGIGIASGHATLGRSIRVRTFSAPQFGHGRSRGLSFVAARRPDRDAGCAGLCGLDHQGILVRLGVVRCGGAALPFHLGQAATDLQRVRLRVTPLPHRRAGIGFEGRFDYAAIGTVTIFSRLDSAPPRKG